MAVELFYTSSPRGLRPHTSGFCTVAMTKGFPAPFIPRLEALSGYKPPLEGAELSECPVAYSHWIVDAAGIDRHVLSAVRATAPDHTGRSNKLAHHVVVRTNEMVSAGPAWLIGQHGVIESRWEGEARQIDHERHLPGDRAVEPRACGYWKEVCGDAGWAGVIANAAMLDPSKPCTVIYPDGVDALRLIAEAMLLLPTEWRWRVTFTSYFMQPIAGLRCTWRFCIDGTEAAAAGRGSAGTVIDLCEKMPCTREGTFIEAARHGPKEPATVGPVSREAAVAVRGTPARPPAMASHSPGPSTTRSRTTTQERPVATGVDYIDTEESESRREGSGLTVGLAIAALVFLVTTGVCFTMWRMEAGRATASQQSTTSPPSAQPVLSDAAQFERQRDAAITEMKGVTAELNDLKGKFSEAETQLESRREEIEALTQENQRLKARLDAGAGVPGAAAPSGAASGRSTFRSDEPGTADDLATPARATGATTVANIDPGPLRAAEWVKFELPSPKKGVSGAWEGSALWTFGSGGHGEAVETVEWFVGDSPIVDKFFFAATKMHFGTDETGALVAELVPQGADLLFAWRVTTADRPVATFDHAAAERALRMVPIRAKLKGGVWVWGLTQALGSRAVGPMEQQISLRSATESLDVLTPGESLWRELPTGEGEVPVELVGAAGTSDPVVVGSMVFTRDATRATVHFEIAAAYDPLVCAREVTEAEKAHASAQRVADGSTDKDKAKAKRAAEDAAKDLESARVKAADAAKILKGLRNWKAMAGQVGSVPIEITVQPPAQPAPTPRGTNQ